MKRYIVTMDESGIYQVIDAEGDYHEGDTWEDLVRDYRLHVVRSFDDRGDAFYVASLLSEIKCQIEEG